MVPDAMVALASLSMTRDSVIELVERSISRKWPTGVPANVYMKFVDYLGLVRTDSSAERIVEMLGQINPASPNTDRTPDGWDEETWVLIVTSLLSGIGAVGQSRETRGTILPIFAVRTVLFLARLPMQLADLRGEDPDGELLEMTSDGSSCVRLLSAPLAVRTIDIRIVHELLVRCFCSHPDKMTQLAVRTAIESEGLAEDEKSEGFTQYLLDSCDEGSKGILLSMTALIASGDSRFLEGIVFDESVLDASADGCSRELVAS